MVEMRVLYLYNARRAHKLLPLLQSFDVVPAKSWREVARFKRSPDGNDLILTDTFGRFGVTAAVASILLRVPLVFRLRGDFFREQPERAAMSKSRLRRLYYWANVLVARVCLWRARLVICNSHYLARTSAPYTRGKQVAVVYNPYTEPKSSRGGKEARKLPEAGLRVLTVSRMNLYSKIQPIYEAIDEWVPPHLWEEWDLHWVICGGGYHEERLRALVERKGLRERVHILGQVEGIRDMYEWSHLLVHLTRMETLGNVVMEAMMCGKPVITNPDSCGVRELVFDGENGFVVKDAPTLLAALRAYMESPALRDRHGAAGRSLIEANFSVDASRREMERVLKEQFGKRSAEGQI
jgi:glycosyltransferase involved in cell wall biosynthesis